MKIPDSFEIHQAARQFRSDLLGTWLARTVATLRTRRTDPARARNAGRTGLRPVDEVQCRA